MNAPHDVSAMGDWTTANQRLLAAEFLCLRARLGDGTVAEDADSQLAAARDAMPDQSAIDRLSELFGLSAFERAVLLLCAGTVMDARLSEACAAAGGRGGVNFGVALAALDHPHWSALTTARPLRALRLIEVDAAAKLSTAPLRIDERVLHFLAGINLPDSRLQPLLQDRHAPALMTRTQQELAGTLASACTRQQAALVQLCGDDSTGAEDIAATVAAQLGLRLMALRVEDLPTAAAELDSFVTLWEREAALLPAGLFLACEDHAPPAAALLAERLSTLLIVASREPFRCRRAALVHRVGKPSMAEQKQLWLGALGAAADEIGSDIDSVASQYRLSARDIELTSATVRARIAAGEPAGVALRRACRLDGRSRLDELAQRIDARAGRDALVVPESTDATLRQIAAQVRNRLRVYGEWGFGTDGTRGLGISVLFAGESGTGKTLAAEVLAADLQLDLYRIDLSSVVSKYIGETEKNLRRLFDAAEDSGAILLFDEADALFGKRSEVKDSHDRYANVEVSYLLQRMEAYRGLAILTTNLKSSLDTAFQRRLRFIVSFPFPDAALRQAMWQRAFPATTPTAGLDFAKLARLHIAGGGVRNVALNAAFLAADENRPVSMAHLLQAAHLDAAKRERSVSESETRGWL